MSSSRSHRFAVSYSPHSSARHHSAGVPLNVTSTPLYSPEGAACAAQPGPPACRAAAATRLPGRAPQTACPGRLREVRGGKWRWGYGSCFRNEHLALANLLLCRLLPDSMSQWGHKSNCPLAPTLAQRDGGRRGPALEQHRQRQREQEEQRGDRVVACLGRRVCNAGKCSVCNPAKASSRGSEGGRQCQREAVQSTGKVIDGDMASGAQQGAAGLAPSWQAPTRQLLHATTHGTLQALLAARHQAASMHPSCPTCLEVCDRGVGHRVPGVDLRQVDAQHGGRHCEQGRGRFGKRPSL